MSCATYSGKNGHFLGPKLFHYFSVFSKKLKNVKKCHFWTIFCHCGAPGYYDLWKQVIFNESKNVTFCHFGRFLKNRWFFSDFWNPYMTSPLWHILKNINFTFLQLFESFSLFSKNAKMWKTCFLHVLKSVKKMKNRTHMVEKWCFMSYLHILASFGTGFDDMLPGSWKWAIGPSKTWKTGPKMARNWKNRDL